MISVALPCYNAEDSLTACLLSLQAQTWQDFEIVAVNDGSTDGTLDVLHRVSSRDSRIRVFDRPHGGVVQAMNFAVEQCRGEYVARMDSDDHALYQQSDTLVRELRALVADLQKNPRRYLSFRIF